MNNKKRIILMMSVALPLFLWAGHQIITNYTVSTSTPPLYNPATLTMTDVIKETEYPAPAFQTEKQPLLDPISNLKTHLNPIRPTPLITPLEHILQRESQPMALFTAKKSPVPPVSMEAIHRAGKQGQHKEPMPTNPIWANLNPYQSTIQTGWDKPLTRKKHHQKKRKKQRLSSTMFSFMPEKAPDIEGILGYTKER